jgi:hypothetical protein
MRCSELATAADFGDCLVVARFVIDLAPDAFAIADGSAPGPRALE